MRMTSVSGFSRTRSLIVVTVCLLATLAVAAGATPTLAQSTGAPPQPAQHRTELEASFLVGAWETRNIEHGQDVRIIFTVWPDGRLLYHFDLGHGLIRGSTGTWQLAGDTLHENWHRPDGSRGAGRGKVEKIDTETMRLTIIDNGDPTYTGMVRIYRRLGPPALS